MFFDDLHLLTTINVHCIKKPDNLDRLSGFLRNLRYIYSLTNALITASLTPIFEKPPSLYKF